MRIVNMFNKQSCEKFVDCLSEAVSRDSNDQRTVLSYALKQYYKPVPWIPQSVQTAALVTVGLFAFTIVCSILQILADDSDEDSDSPSEESRPIVPPAYPLPTNEVSEPLVVHREKTLNDALLQLYGYYLNVDREVRRGVVRIVEWLKGI